MRPIDADALLSKIKENDYLLYDRLTDTTKPGMFTLGIEYAIRTAPTIIEAEGKAGRWIVQITGWGDMYYECSYCKGAITLIDGTPEDNFYCYCPHCGARMEE